MDTQQQNNIQLPEEEGIDIKKYIFLILSHWWWFAITLFVSITVAYLVNRYSQQIYSASTSIIIGEPQGSVGSIDNILDELTKFRGQKRKAVVENEISILKSYKMARLALEELDFRITYTAVGRRNIAEAQLYKSCPFVVIRDTAKSNPAGVPINILLLSNDKYKLSIGESFEKTLRFGEKFENESVGFTILLRHPETYVYYSHASNKFFFAFNEINSQANAYSKSLNVEVNNEKGSILTLAMQGFVPEQISDYLNKLCEVYIRSNLLAKNLATENTIRFIDDQLRGVIDSLEITGLKLQNFRSANKVIDLGKEGNFLYDQIQALQSERVMLDLNDRYYNYLLDYIKEKSDFSDVVAPSVVGIQDQLLNSLVIDLNALNMQKRNLDYSVQESSPQNSYLISQITNTRNALQENLSSLVDANSMALKSLNQRMVKIDAEVQKLPSTERQLINIQRKFTINDQIYTFLLQKRAEAGITRASNTSDHKTLDIARPENAQLVKPKTSMNYMMSIAIGGALPLVLLLIMEFFNTRITDRRHLESHLKVPIIGNVGHSDEQSELPVNEKPGSSLAESFRALRTSLQYILKEPDAKVIALSSAVSGEGKTFCSVNLATIFAMAGRKTLIVSLDLRRPKVHRVFNMENKLGMSTYLIGKHNFEEVLCETNIKNLFLVCSGPIPPNPSELIDSDRMNEFIVKARASFDYIILDTPPVAIVSDTMILKNVMDAFIFVIRHNYSDRHVVDLVNHIYSDKLINNTCVIINDIQVKGYYGYSYRYEYGYGYGYSYNYRHDYYTDNDNKKGFLWKFIRNRK